MYSTVRSYPHSYSILSNTNSKITILAVHMRMKKINTNTVISIPASDLLHAPTQKRNTNLIRPHLLPSASTSLILSIQSPILVQHHRTLNSFHVDAMISIS